MLKRYQAAVLDQLLGEFFEPLILALIFLVLRLQKYVGET